MHYFILNVQDIEVNGWCLDLDFKNHEMGLKYKIFLEIFKRIENNNNEKKTESNWQLCYFQYENAELNIDLCTNLKTEIIVFHSYKNWWVSEEYE